MATERGGLEYTLRVKTQGLNEIQRFRREVDRLQRDLNSLSGRRGDGLGNLATSARQATQEVQRLTAVRRNLSRVSRTPIIPPGTTAQFRRVANQQRVINRQARETQRVFRGIGSSLRQFGQIGLLVGAFEAIAAASAGVRGFVTAVTEFNSQLERSELGIAAIVSSLSDVRDITGQTVSGAEALAAAQGIASDQVAQLRRDALQTAATFEQLTEAFQQAVGPGLEAGLGLDEIRQFTVRISQAAGALGLEQFQLPEEIRSLLRGTITPRTTRIASALGITNEDIRQARELGTLAEFLQERFAQFGFAGREALNTFDAVVTNTTDALRQAIGTGAIQFFDDLKTVLQDVQGALVTDTAAGLQVNPEVLAAVSELGSSFGQVFIEVRRLARVFGGDLVGSARRLGNVIRTAIQFASGLFQGLVSGASDVVAVFEQIGSVLQQLTGEDTLQAAVAQTAEWAVELAAVLVAFRAITGFVGPLIRGIAAAASRAAVLRTALAGAQGAGVTAGAGAGFGAAAQAGAGAAALRAGAVGASLVALVGSAGVIANSFGNVRSELEELNGEAATFADTIQLAFGRTLQRVFADGAFGAIGDLFGLAEAGERLEQSILDAASAQGELNRQLEFGRRLAEARAEASEAQEGRIATIRNPVTPRVESAELLAQRLSTEAQVNEAISRNQEEQAQLARSRLSLEQQAQQVFSRGTDIVREEALVVNRILQARRTQITLESDLARARASNSQEEVRRVQTQIQAQRDFVEANLTDLAARRGAPARSDVQQAANQLIDLESRLAQNTAETNRLQTERLSLVDRVLRAVREQQALQNLGVRGLSGLDARNVGPSTQALDEQISAQREVNSLILRGEARGLSFRRAEARLSRASAAARLSQLDAENRFRRDNLEVALEEQRDRRNAALADLNDEFTGEDRRLEATRKLEEAERRIAALRGVERTAEARSLSQRQQATQRIAEAERLLEPSRGEQVLEALGRGLEFVGETIVGGIGSAIDAVGGFFSDLFGLNETPQIDDRGGAGPAPTQTPEQEAVEETPEVLQDELAVLQEILAQIRIMSGTSQTSVSQLSRISSQLGELLAAIRAQSQQIAAALASTNQRAVGRAEGGLIPAGPRVPAQPGLSPRDRIPVLAEPGEFMLRAAAVRRLGLPYVQALNDGLEDPSRGLRGTRRRTVARMTLPKRGFQTGGSIGSAGAASQQAQAVMAVLVNDDSFARSLFESPEFARGIFNNQETIRSVL